MKALIMIDNKHIIERFFSYVTIDTESDPNSKTTPSTKKQTSSKLQTPHQKDGGQANYK